MRNDPEKKHSPWFPLRELPSSFPKPEKWKGRAGNGDLHFWQPLKTEKMELGTASPPPPPPDPLRFGGMLIQKTSSVGVCFFEGTPFDGNQEESTRGIWVTHSGFSLGKG